MALDPSYLEYPARREGMDHTLYPWSNLFTREPVSWPNGKSVAVSTVVDVEWFPIIPADKPFKAPGHMQTAYPDYRHYTSREYGTRVGLYRLLDAFEQYGIAASMAVNSAVAQRYPEVIEAILGGGHEIVAHSTDMNGTIATGLNEEDERALIRDSLDALEEATGTRPKGWLSIARSQSWNTPSLLAEAGVEYMCDWVNDELPYRMSTDSGEIVNFPLNHELSDRQVISVQQHSAESYREQITDAYQWLSAESATYGGRLLPLQLTPYIMGLPYRMAAFEELLGFLRSRDDVWFASAGEIVQAVRN